MCSANEEEEEEEEEMETVSTFKWKEVSGFYMKQRGKGMHILADVLRLAAATWQMWSRILAFLIHVYVLTLRHFINDVLISLHDGMGSFDLRVTWLFRKQ